MGLATTPKTPSAIGAAMLCLLTSTDLHLIAPCCVITRISALPDLQPVLPTSTKQNLTVLTVSSGRQTLRPLTSLLASMLKVNITVSSEFTTRNLSERLTMQPGMDLSQLPVPVLQPMTCSDLTQENGPVIQNTRETTTGSNTRYPRYPRFLTGRCQTAYFKLTVIKSSTL